VRGGRGRVEALARGRDGRILGPLVGERAVLALPLGVRQAGAVRFDPPLTDKQPALGRLEMGAVIKVTLRFRERFWEGRPAGARRGARRDMTRLGFLRAPGEPIPTWWTSYPLLAPLLIGWVGGPGAATLAGLSDEAIADRALDVAGRAFGTGRA